MRLSTVGQSLSVRAGQRADVVLWPRELLTRSDTEADDQWQAWLLQLRPRAVFKDGRLVWTPAS